MSESTASASTDSTFDARRPQMAGDLDSARTVFAPDVRYVVPGRNPLSGAYHGPDEVMGYFGRLMAVTGGTYEITSMHWMTSDDHVTLFIANTATVGERSLEWDEAIVFKFEDGRKKRIWHLSGDQYAVDALFAAEQQGHA